MRHHGNGKFVILVIFGVLSSFVFAAGKLSYYKAISEERLSPLGSIDVPVPMGPYLVDQSSAKIAFLGDSRARDWAEYYASYQGFSVLNLGVDGQTTAQVLYRMGHQLPNLEAEVVVIQVGINDLKVIGFNREIFRDVVDDCKKNISQLVALIERDNRQVVISTIFPRGELNFIRRFIWSKYVDLAILEVNNYIRREFSGRVTIIDAYSILSPSGFELSSEYSSDFLHLNRIGYEAISLEENLMRFE